MNVVGYRPFILQSQESINRDQRAEQDKRDVTRWAEELRTEAGLETTSQVEAVLHGVASLRRDAYRFNVTQSGGDSSPDTRLVSKFGGLPFLRPGEPWPGANYSTMSEHEEEEEEGGGHTVEFLFMCQFLVSELPPAVQEVLGRTDGMLQFFVDEELPGYDINGDDDYYLVRVVSQEDLDLGPVNMTEPSETRVMQEQQVSLCVQRDDYPHPDDLEEMLGSAIVPSQRRRQGGDDEEGDVTHEGGPPWSEALNEVLEAFGDHEMIETVGGDKLLGWPRWCQGAEWAQDETTGDKYLQLLQLEAEHCDGFSIGDSGTLVVQVHPQDKSKFRVGWACC